MTICKCTKHLDFSLGVVRCLRLKDSPIRDSTRWNFIRAVLSVLSEDDFQLLLAYHKAGDYDLLMLLNGLGYDWAGSFKEVQGIPLSDNQFMDTPISEEQMILVKNELKDTPDEIVLMHNSSVNLRSWTRVLFERYGLNLPNNNVELFPSKETWLNFTGLSRVFEERTTYEKLELEDFLLVEQEIPD